MRPDYLGMTRDLRPAYRGGAAVGAITPRPLFPSRGETQAYAARIDGGIETLASAVHDQFVAIDPATITDDEATLIAKLAFVKKLRSEAALPALYDSTVADAQNQLDAFRRGRAGVTNGATQAAYRSGFDSWYKGWKSLKAKVDDLGLLFQADIWDNVQAYETDLPKWRDAFTAAGGMLVTPAPATPDEVNAAHTGSGLLAPFAIPTSWFVAGAVALGIVLFLKLKGSSSGSSAPRSTPRSAPGFDTGPSTIRTSPLADSQR